MARILVTGNRGSLGSRHLLEALVARIRADGHDGALLANERDAVQAVRETDAVVALFDGALDAEAAAALAFATAQQKPTLALHHGDIPPFIGDLATKRTRLATRDDIGHALEPFYETVRPFAGRLVRDEVPRLVREAGHDVHFRQVPESDRPRFLKRKVAEESRDLEKSDAGDEKEQIADLLEALETLIEARGYTRDDLRAVKEGKRKRRGGFARGFVVEAVNRDVKEDAPPQTAAARTETTKTAAPDAPRKGDAAGPPPMDPSYEGPVWEAGDEPEPEPMPAPAHDARRVEPEIRDV